MTGYDTPAAPPARFTRRTFLGVLGTAGAAGLLAACGNGGGGGATTTTTAAATTTTTAAGTTATTPGAGAAAGSGPVTVGGFPSKALRIMAPAAPGGGWDSTSRRVQQVLQEQKIAAQNVEVFNRAGAGGTIGLAEFVNQNRGDGHTVMTMGLVMTGAIETNKSPVKLDTTVPLARLIAEYEAIAVSKDSKYQTARQLFDDFKKDPKAIRWGGGSSGGADHICLGLIAQNLQVDPKNINYVAFSGGGELRPQLIGNQVTAAVNGYGELKGDAQTGQIRILAISSPSRLPGLDAPTLKEAGVDLEFNNWRGMVGPPGMKDNERQAWVTMLTRMHDTRAWQEILQQQDWIDSFLTGDQFAQFIKQDQERVARVLRDIGLVQ